MMLGGLDADEEIYRKAQEAAADYLAELGVEDEGEAEEEEQDDEDWDEEEEEEGDVAAGAYLLSSVGVVKNVAGCCCGCC